MGSCVTDFSKPQKPQRAPYGFWNRPGDLTEGEGRALRATGNAERAARIGGKLTVITSAFGTEIRLIVPGVLIFQTSDPVRQGLLAKMRTLFRLKGQDSNLD